jgi:hypothetical protein
MDCREAASYGRSTLNPRLLTITDGPHSNSALACRYPVYRRGRQGRSIKELAGLSSAQTMPRDVSDHSNDVDLCAEIFRLRECDHAKACFFDDY